MISALVRYLFACANIGIVETIVDHGRRKSSNFLDGSGIKSISIVVFVHRAKLTGSLVEREYSCLVERERKLASGPRRSEIDLGGILCSISLPEICSAYE